MAKKIRLAMFRVDFHLYHYAPVLAKLNMRQFRELSSACHYWFTDCYDPFTVVPKVAGGFQVVAVGDYDSDKAQEGAGVFLDKPRATDDPKDLLRDVDAAFICNCDLDGSDHRKLAEPFIRKRIPTFIDKPFALATTDAIAMVNLAKRYRTPIYSSSLLSVAYANDNLRRRFNQIGGAVTGMVCGAPGWATPSGQEGVIHGVSLLQGVFGYAAKWVQAFGDHPGHIARVGYSSGLEVGMYLKPGIGGYTVEVFGANRDPNPRHLFSDMIDNTDYAVGASIIAHRFRRMVRTGKPPRDYDEMIENIAVCEALRRSRKTGRKVAVREVWKR